MQPDLTLMSHHLCPYVQRAVISLTEKKAKFDRTYIDLANKPDWFLEISPLGKTPTLKVGDKAIFESSAILEYLEDTISPSLHPEDPITKAGNRSWIEFGSSVLNDIGGLYNAPDEKNFQAKIKILSDKFQQIEDKLEDGPYFNGNDFSLVDAVFGPVFRYFDVFDRINCFGIFKDKPKVQKWRRALQERPSIQSAVTENYEDLLWQFLLNRKSWISQLMTRDD